MTLWTSAFSSASQCRRISVRRMLIHKFQEATFWGESGRINLTVLCTVLGNLEDPKNENRGNISASDRRAIKVHLFWVLALGNIRVVPQLCWDTIQERVLQLLLQARNCVWCWGGGVCWHKIRHFKAGYQSAVLFWIFAASFYCCFCCIQV